MYNARKTNLDMPRDLLLALEPLLSVPGTPVPEAFVVRLAPTNVHVVYMCRQGVAGVERGPTGLPAAFVRAATAVVTRRRDRGQRLVDLVPVLRLGWQ